MRYRIHYVTPDTTYPLVEIIETKKNSGKALKLFWAKLKLFNKPVDKIKIVKIAKMQY